MRAVFFLSLSLVAVGCSKPSGPPQPTPTPHAEAIATKEGDPKMKAAIKAARADLGQFTAALRSPRGRSQFSIKARFDDGPSIEYMWLKDVKLSGDAFLGRLANRPEKVKNITEGEVVRVFAPEITDWMFVERGRLIGGQTIRVLASRLTPQARAALEREGGFRL